MRRMIFWLCLFTLLPTVGFGQELTRSSADEFLKALFKGNDSLTAFVDDSALSVSNRLGITYDGMPAKFLISYDFDEEIRKRVSDGRMHYTSFLEPCCKGCQRLTVETDRPHVVRKFYFKNGRMISPLSYHTAGWHTIETKFFRFIVSDSTLTNRYAMRSLDRFVSDMSSTLGFTDEELNTLSDKKILYYLCKDEDEIERLTDYRTRGMYNLAYDALISTYNTHYHELAHLLINYKARSAKIYCNPFLLEGFAVAVGGRGGLDADVAASLGSFLEETKMLSYAELLTQEGFNAVDPSMSYPAAGLYNSFLLEAVGGGRYLELCRRHCGNSNDVNVRTLSESELPSVEAWNAFLARYRTRMAVRLLTPAFGDTLLYRNDSVSVYRGKDEYMFKIRSACAIGTRSVEAGYRSKRFIELLPNNAYHGEKYLIMADSQSVSVYNLLTNNLIASYAASFSSHPQTAPVEDGMFCISVPAGIYDEPLDTLLSGCIETPTILEYPKKKGDSSAL